VSGLDLRWAVAPGERLADTEVGCRSWLSLSAPSRHRRLCAAHWLWELIAVCIARICVGAAVAILWLGLGAGMRLPLMCCTRDTVLTHNDSLTGIHILTDKRIDTEVQPLAVAKILAHVAKEETPDLVLVGKQSIDGDNNQTGACPCVVSVAGMILSHARPHVTFISAQMLSGLMDWPQATFASEVKVDGAEVRRYCVCPCCSCLSLTVLSRGPMLPPSRHTAPTTERNRHP